MTAGASVDVLVVAHDDDLRRLTVTLLQRGGFSTVDVRGHGDARSAIERDRPHVVVCGLDVEHQRGIELLKSLQGEARNIGMYRILLGAMPHAELADYALEAVADDFLSTDHLHANLLTRVRVGMRMWRMHHELREAAVRDGLTGLFNQHHFHSLLDSEMARSRRYGHAVSLILLDLDRFKSINDTFGHLVGNQVLEDVARTIRHCVRDVEIVARIGGEEFAVIVPQCCAADAVSLAERIRTALPQQVRPAVPDAPDITASFGIADTECKDVCSAAKLMDLADRALYAAKREGRNRVCCGVQLVDRTEVESAAEHDEVEWLRRRLNVLGNRMKDAYVQSVTTLLGALEEKNAYAARHSANVACYADKIARHLGCSNAICKSVYNAALLHDIGLIGVPDAILRKRTPLTPLEQMVLEQVPRIGTRILDHLRILESELQMIRHQHEFFDGSGTPTGLRGDMIPIGSRIILVADTFDTLTTNRIFRHRCAAEDALARIKGHTPGRYDPAVVQAIQSLYLDQRRDWETRIRETLSSARVGDEDHYGAALA